MSVIATVAGTLHAHGVSHLSDYAMNTMRIESAGRADARNSASSATGLFQFVRDTWEDVMPGVPFSQATDPRQNTIAFIRLTERNERYLEGRLDREPEDWEVYLAHFAGAGRAAQLLEASPNARLDSIFSERAMRANPHLGRLGTVENYLAWVQAKYNDEPAPEISRQYALSDGSGIEDDEDRFGDNERGRRMTQESLRHDNQVTEDSITAVMSQMFEVFITAISALFGSLFGASQADSAELGQLASQETGEATQRDASIAARNA